MGVIAKTPAPPYYAVIFTSLRTQGDNGYSSMAEEMVDLAVEQPGFLGVESVREELGITISYWKDMESIVQWKNDPRHQKAQQLGRSKWYGSFKVRVVKVERDSEF
ncbi:antibiotic biosynthesis monooxygenase [Maridesulfovibrio sp.]|uniref:antibiotic biosynthesis monooxygenase family protein n=1 Tax=Maridesulfovibrio sp. TaxID=2795000 RepID=UPI002A18972D|nr:antibiotic biosynthesis monooxygenase [Maridesulfovibrio sp.]